MFTGIIEQVGRVARVTPRGEVLRIVVDETDLGANVALGDSVAVNGTCVTQAELDGRHLHFDAVQETLDRTTLGGLEPGRRVNLERAMRADARFDGHIVQGHVDETGRVRDWRREGDDVRLYIETSPDFASALVPKGSVTIDGVSLTVVDVVADGFDVALIPHTLAVTTLGELQVGDGVNLEGDVLGKYVKRYLDQLGIGASGAA